MGRPRARTFRFSTTSLNRPTTRRRRSVSSLPSWARGHSATQVRACAPRDAGFVPIIRRNVRAGFERLKSLGYRYLSLTPACRRQVHACAPQDASWHAFLKKLAARGGLDAAKYPGHSLRVGAATSGAITGASERSITKQTGHRSVQKEHHITRTAPPGGPFDCIAAGRSTGRARPDDSGEQFVGHFLR